MKKIIGGRILLYFFSNEIKVSLQIMFCRQQLVSRQFKKCGFWGINLKSPITYPFTDSQVWSSVYYMCKCISCIYYLTKQFLSRHVFLSFSRNVVFCPSVFKVLVVDIVVIIFIRRFSSTILGVDEKLQEISSLWSYIMRRNWIHTCNQNQLIDMEESSK